MTLLPFILLFALPARAADLSSATISSPYELVRSTLPTSPEYGKVPFFPEDLEFEVKWGIFSVGTSNLKVQEVVDFNGQPAYHVVSEAKSSPFCDRFYPVRDLNESWVRVSDRRSLGYSKKLREGNFFRDEWVLYDYIRKAFLSRRVNKDGSSSYSNGSIPGPVQDILSSLYFIRPSPLKVGDEITLDVNTKSNWPLVVKVLGKETITVPAGTFHTVIVEPFMRQEGIFVQKGKDLKVWLTDDERHLPVFMRADIAFGSVSAYLTSVQP